MAKKKLFEGVSFDALCKRYLKEGAGRERQVARK